MVEDLCEFVIPVRRVAVVVSEQTKVANQQKKTVTTHTLAHTGTHERTQTRVSRFSVTVVIGGQTATDRATDQPLPSKLLPPSEQHTAKTLT